jgi:hypothetical protein
MRARTFRVPFSRVAPDAVELEWGPDDYMVVRPLLTRSAAEAIALQAKLDSVSALPRDAAGQKAGRALILEVIGESVTEWSLTDADGRAIPLPRTDAEYLALPSGLVQAIFGFLMSYRGETEGHPTIAV